MSLDDYYGILNDTLGSRLFSFDDLLQDGEHEGLHEDGASAHLEPSRDLEDERFQAALADAIANLPERERLVLALYYDEELNLKEIGEVLGVSESRVSQLHSQCAARLRGVWGVASALRAVWGRCERGWCGGERHRSRSVVLQTVFECFAGLIEMARPGAGRV